MLRVIKAAQRLGFTLDEVADLLEVSHLRAGARADAGLHALLGFLVLALIGVRLVLKLPEADFLLAVVVPFSAARQRDHRADCRELRDGPFQGVGGTEDH